MRIRHVCYLLTVIFIITIAKSSSEDSKYFEIENHERRLEYDNRATPAYPEAESYVIGVKRALLPFRQLSKYLRRPVAADARSATVTEVPGIQWRLPVPPPNELVMAAPDTEDRVTNHKRDKSEPDGDDTLYPEIILIRPINISKLSAAKINNINKGLEDAIKARKAPEDVKLTDDSIKTAVTKQQKLSACTENQKKVKIDHQIFQGNGINIKLTFSVDVGNQSKPLENNNTANSFRGTSCRPTRKSVHH